MPKKEFRSHQHHQSSIVSSIPTPAPEAAITYDGNAAFEEFRKEIKPGSKREKEMFEVMEAIKAGTCLCFPFCGVDSYFLTS